MNPFGKLAAAAAGAALFLSACSTGGTIGGADYAPQYDFWEFFAATDGKEFRVVTSGNPFPSMSVEEMRVRLLPVLQANRPRPRLTFTYAAPQPERRPDYRLVLVFDPALDLGAQRVCEHQFRHRQPTSAGHQVFAVYCRNDQALSQATTSTEAATPEDPQVGQMFRGLFLVLFTELPPNRRRPFPFGVGFP